jgi:hypothetical protein
MSVFLFVREVDGGSVCEEVHKVLVARGRNLLTSSPLKNHPFLIPPNRLKCGKIESMNQMPKRGFTFYENCARI